MLGFNLKLKFDPIVLMHLLNIIWQDVTYLIHSPTGKCKWVLFQLDWDQIDACFQTVYTANTCHN